MTWTLDPSATAAAAALLGLSGLWSAARGLRLLGRGLRAGEDPAASLWLIRGLRGGIVGVALAALAAGLLAAQTWLVVFGAIFLAEELYETGVVVLALRSAARRSARRLDPAESSLPS